MPAADVYVATNGNDKWSGGRPEPNAGGTDGPFATLARARDAARGVRDRDVTVLVRGGTYRLTETVVFSTRDSAGRGRTVTYAAYPGETPVFSSALPVTGWRKPDKAPPGLPARAEGKVWTADVSKHPAMRPVADGRSPRFFTLYDGEAALPRARSKGFSPVDAAPEGLPGYYTVRVPPHAVTPYANLDDAELLIVPSRFWIMNILPLKAMEVEKALLTTAQPGTYALGRNGMTDRDSAWIENAIEDLDEPGEWVLDSSQRQLYYWPRGAEPGPQVAAPTLTELIRVEGDIDYEGPLDTPVRGIVFRGLTFSQGDRLPWHGRTGWGLQHDWEMFDKPTALVRFRGAEECAVEDCTFANSAHTAIRLDLHCRGNRVVGNHIHHVGGVGVLLAGYGPGTKDVNRGNQVTNNYIHHIGRTYWGSGAIFAWQSGENHIAHNHIHSIPYTGILVTGRISRGEPGPAECSRTVRWHETPDDYRKWPWSKREPYLHGRKNIVEYNDIHHAMEVTGDGNCIYISGTGTGNVVRHNLCHDCDGKYMNAVIRCDDDQHGTLMSHNVCFRTRGHAEGFISKGDNDIVNNVVADLNPNHAHRGYIVFPYGSVKGSVIQRNILFSRRRGQSLFFQNHGRRGAPPPRLRDTSSDYNLYHCTEDPIWAEGHLRTERELGIEQHSASADPMFVDLDAPDVRFRSGSPAAAMGIEPIDIRQAGLEPAYHDRLIGPAIRTRIAPESHVFRGPVTVTITATGPKAEIRYTLDGSEPTRISPLYEEPFTLAEPGVVRARAFARHATDLFGAKTELAAPPSPIREDFESAPIGRTAPRAETQEDETRKEYTARITDEQAASGRQSLKFVDGPGQKYPFNPHVFYRCRFTEGPLNGRFDLRVDARGSLFYQWRQYGQGFIRGPSIMVQPGGKVLHEGTELLTIPTEEWVRFEVRCTLSGEAECRSFDFLVHLPGSRTPRIFEGLACEPGFERLDWVGFVANGAENAVFYVDNVTIGPPE